MSGSQIHKLRRMSRQEISFRIQARLGRLYEESCYALGLQRDPEPALTRSDPGEILFANPWLAAMELGAVCDRLLSQHLTYAQEIQKAADMVCDRQFMFFGNPVRYPSRISWCADPLSDTAWPMLFHTRIDIFGGDTGNGDVKYVWELNRHQFLPVLGKAYCLTMDEKYAETALELMEDWIRANPYKIGINWTSALEVAVRSLSWCWTCGLLQDTKAFSPSRRQSILRSLYQHGRYIEEHLSFFFSPYNHLIGEATALFVLGSLLPWLQPAQGWKEAGWAILEDTMPKQFYADGGTVEQATGYHHFTLGFYLQAVLLRRGQGLVVPERVWSLLEKACEFSMYIMRPDGSVPMIGDGDEGKALDLCQASVWDFRPYLAIGAVLFQRGDLKKMAGEFPPDAAWLVGCKGVEKYHALTEAVPTETSKALSESGYYVMRTSWERQAHYLNLDCGAIADGVSQDDLPSAAHGHADALSIEVSAFGEPVLVDPGFYTYNGEINWHRYFRETEAHNTVVVDGRSQAAYRGRLKWAHAPRTECHHWVSSLPFDYAEGSHDGYARMSQPVMHRRAVAFIKPDYWLIRDELIGEGEHQIDRYFHFVPGRLGCDGDAKSVQFHAATGAHLAVFAVEQDGIGLDILHDGTTPDAGWLAPGYATKVRAPVVRYRMHGHLPVVVHTLLLPCQDAPGAIQVAVESLGARCLAPGGHTIRIHHGTKHDVIFFSAAPGLVPFYRNWQTDGHVAWVRLDQAGAVEAWAVLGGSCLVVDGRALLRVGTPQRFAALAPGQGEPVLELAAPAVDTTPLPQARMSVAEPAKGSE